MARCMEAGRCLLTPVPEASMGHVFSVHDPAAVDLHGRGATAHPRGVLLSVVSECSDIENVLEAVRVVLSEMFAV